MTKISLLKEKDFEVIVNNIFDSNTYDIKEVNLELKMNQSIINSGEEDLEHALEHFNIIVKRYINDLKK